MRSASSVSSSVAKRPGNGGPTYWFSSFKRSQRRRVKARVEKRARMMKLDAITLQFAREVIEEETGAPLEIQSATASASAQDASASQAKLVARDEKKNPLISTFDWTEDATKRILRVPAGFMRNKTQERIEELARERAAACRAEAFGEGGGIDLALVEDGIEIGKRRSTISPPMDSLERRISRCAGSVQSRRSVPGRTASPDSPSLPTSKSRRTFSIGTGGRLCRSALSSRMVEPV
jgi:hypothetical protein